MPPSITAIPKLELKSGGRSLEAQIELNMEEITRLMVRIHKEQHDFVEKVQREQNELAQQIDKEQSDYAEELESLQEVQQALLKRLNAVKSDAHIQEINGLKAEKQLLQPSDSGVFSDGDDAPDSTPTPSSMTARLGSFNLKRKAVTIDDEDSKPRPVKVQRVQLDPNVDAELDLVTEATTDLRGAEATSSNATAPTIYLTAEEQELEIDEDDSAWEKDGQRLREAWVTQLKEFNKKNPEWATKITTAGCVRSALWNQGKCYLTKERGGDYACRTCWNTGHLCVAFDKGDNCFWLRPQLPAARAKNVVGPYDLERFHSMKMTASRTDVPAYWEKNWTS
ncbi:hypothetical protein E4T38_06197 [Aureobasidium subglaciale]|nr:hypothetical protein E4T38_06197 [Aureobasidium subglaciale]KAI5219896.1 hypothetical protein E4T40_06218 [Aureobasidium subglaciale]KAI5223688.1 hypothetical protein E4T41_05979 [Aureobasidium subglaciale]KAI5260565.1 hypothetical protein E4T46_05952 [Aureobasidium subglaciale]